MHITLICADEDYWALGMRSISASLNEKGHQTRLVFTDGIVGPFDDHSLDHIVALSRGTHLIGISSMSRGSQRAKQIIAGLRTLGTKIVWGGMHPTLYPHDCLPAADIICRGEGEEFMAELAERLNQGLEFRDMLGGGYFEDGRIVLNEIRPLVEDLDKLPIVDFSFRDEFHIGRTRSNSPHPLKSNSSSILISGSRGCTGNCHYCSNAQLKLLYKEKGRYLRKMEGANLVAVAGKCLAQFPRAKYIFFTDEDFFSRTIEDIKIFSEDYAKDVDLSFQVLASPQRITSEKLELLVKSGLVRLDIGVESGSERIKREIFNRPVSNETIIKAAEIINRYPQLIVFYFIIIGNPYDARQDLLDTISLVSRLPAPFYLQAYNLVFIPGTILFEKALADGIISGISDSGYELDFLAGLDYKKHSWKNENLYLNSLLFLMAGRSTRLRIGLVPRFLIKILVHPRTIDINERFRLLSTVSIFAAKLALKARRSLSKALIKLISDPRSISNIKNRFYKATKKNVLN